MNNNQATRQLRQYAHAAELWSKGKNPWITIDNPNANNETNKQRIRVRANDHWGVPLKPVDFMSRGE